MAYTVTTEKTWSRILDDLEESFRKWGSVQLGWRVETVLAPRSATKVNQTQQERTVALHWKRRNKDYAITMKNQSRAVDNLLVIWLIVEALRLNEARGFAAQIAEVYRQEFPALPAPGQTSAVSPLADDPYTVLYLYPGAPLIVAEAAYKALARLAHPDAGGSEDVMASLNEAIAAIRKQRGG